MSEKWKEDVAQPIVRYASLAIFAGTVLWGIALLIRLFWAMPTFHCAGQP